MGTNIFIKNNTEFFENTINPANGMDLLKQISTDSIKVVFFDPQYRGVLDKLSYGNEGESRGKQRSNLPQMTEKIIQEFFKEIDRILVPSGYLFLWIDKFHLVEGIQSWLQHKRLKSVDMITWNKLKMGMGYRTRRQSEYLVVLQKEPLRAKQTWKIHNIPDVWSERVEKNHPHSKPVKLQKELIMAVTNKGDVVVDPAAGGYSVLKACRASNRRFLGCDLLKPTGVL